MKRIVLSLLVIVCLLSAGCIGYSPDKPEPNVPSAPVPAPTGQRPPDTINWISPAKITVSNFHLGAVADCFLTVHNVNKVKTTFIVEPRVADFTAAEHMKVPKDILQDWVLVADMSPILGALETRDILIILEMPAEVDAQQAQFWQVTGEGSAYFATLQTAALKAVTDEATRQIREKYKDSPQNILPEMINELVTPAAIERELMKNPDAPLLLYMLRNSSVSFRKFQIDQAWNVVLATSFEQRGYMLKGDLREGKWEFWISVMEAPQPGVTGTRVVTETASRWLVAMR